MQWLADGLQGIERLLPATVSLVEVIWTIPALLGLWRYLGYRYRAALAQLHAIQDDPTYTAAERLTQEARCARFAYLSFVFYCFLMLGMRSLFYPQPPGYTILDPENWVPALPILAAEIALFLKGELLDKYERAVARLYRQMPVPDSIAGRPPRD